ncbi:MAG TPA: YciI-like protein [Sporichthya sp.]|nr:YciI-like protein [Sporichthya sp.]
MTHLLLEYALADNYLERRPEFRAEHLALLEGPVARGEVVLAGALPDPFDRALFIWAEGAEEAAKAFVAADPYVANGLVTGWQLRTWNTVVGAAMPPA